MEEATTPLRRMRQTPARVDVGVAGPAASLASGIPSPWTSSPARQITPGGRGGLASLPPDRQSAGIPITPESLALAGRPWNLTGTSGPSILQSNEGSWGAGSPGGPQYGHVDSAAEDGDIEISDDGGTLSSDSYDEQPPIPAGWRIEQIMLNEVLKGRDEYSFFPGHWQMHLRGMPLPPGLFYTQAQAVSRRPRIYERSPDCAFKGVVAFRKLIDVHGRVRDYFQEREQIPNGNFELRAFLKAKMVQQLGQALVQAVQWALLDGGLARYGPQIPPVLDVVVWEDRATLQDHVGNLMKVAAFRWRSLVQQHDPSGMVVAPVIFTFAVAEHVCYICSLDTANEQAAFHVPMKLNFAAFHQNMWTAVGVMTTVCWARDIAMDTLVRLGIPLVAASPESDPDA